MTNDELNLFIKHYVEEDHTGRAIMLTGPWGMGKSYYIKHSLIPFLEKPQNGEHQCVIVSLYGVSDLDEISKAIYIGTRIKKLVPESEKANAAILTGKTVLKGVASFFGVSLDADEQSLKKLYRSIDLSGKLIIFEDVERAGISILEFLGFVNNLVEQDGVKVLLVTNEEEILQYESTSDSEETQETDSENSFDEERKTAPKKYTKDTIRYLETKEKSVGDTISFSGDLQSAIKEIIGTFDNSLLKSFANDQAANDIGDIMLLLRSSNLRSIIYACQKTADIFSYITGKEGFSEDFITTVFYGIVFFSLRVNSGTRCKWIGLEQYSLELGSEKYPLFRFCFDYITEQKLDVAEIAKAAEALKAFRLYNQNKALDDQDLQVLGSYYLHSEAEVRQAISNIEQRLEKPEDVSFQGYGLIATAAVSVKYNLGCDIENIKKLLIANLHGQGAKIRGEELFWYSFDENDPAARQEFEILREAMINSLKDNFNYFPDFNYLPEQAKTFETYVSANRGKFFSARGFAKFIDIDKLVQMFAQCSPAQMNAIRAAFHSIYHVANMKEFLHEDALAIAELQNGLEMTWERPDVDAVQLLHYRCFIEYLKDIKKRLD